MQEELDGLASNYPTRFKVYYVLNQVYFLQIDLPWNFVWCAWCPSFTYFCLCLDLLLVWSNLESSIDCLHCTLAVLLYSFKFFFLFILLRSLLSIFLSDCWWLCLLICQPPPDQWNGGVGFVSKEMIQAHCPAPAPDIQVLCFCFF